MYFTPENAGRIDAAREELERWRKAGKVDEDSYYVASRRHHRRRGPGREHRRRVCLLHEALAAEREAAVRGRRRGARQRSPAGHGDADGCDRRSQGDRRRWTCSTSTLLTTRGNTWPTTIYRRSWRAGWTDSAPAIRGKVGLLAGEEGRSQWSHGRRVQRLFSGLLAASGARHALVSFNSEGHLAPDKLQTLLTRASIDGTVAHYTQRYRRYRADSEREGRHHHGDIALEHLYLVRLR